MLSVCVAVGVVEIEVAVDLDGIVVPDCYAGLGHGGYPALQASLKPLLLCEPSQNGLSSEPPQRQR